MASSAASLSPTTAALLRASPNSRPHHHHNHHNHHNHHHNHHNSNSNSNSNSFSHQSHHCNSGLQQRPSPLLASTTPRSSPRQTATSQQQQHSADSGSCSSPEIEQLRTTFKRQTVDAGTQYSRPSTPSDPAAAAAAGESSRMPGTAIGTKRTPPDATKVIAGPGPASAPALSKNPHSQQQPQQQQQSQQQQQQQQQQPQQLPQQQQARQQNQRRQQLDDDDRPPEGSASKRLRPAKPPVKLLPRRYEAADPRDLVVLISSMIMELIRFNDQIPLRDGRLTRFHSRSPPRISVQDYLQRLTTHATLSPPILLSMVYYIDRLCALYPAFTISSLTVHRFLISSATVASKGLSDSFWTNKTYARVGGISVEELALLELEFLWRVEWRIVPQPEVLVDYYLSLVERCDDYEMQPELPPPIPPAVTAAGGARSIRAPAAAPPAAAPAPAPRPAPAASSAPADSQPKSHVKPEPSTTTAAAADEKTEPDSAQSTASSST
ncbi:TPA_exp: Uncharacterized protein A8136_0205 [Trichophyton benhamiae CBS 112371]|nr:TPA_exp: Uncharacterized protein A8136_0205 [Trichophyton benhamiae CBS 112371]